MNKKLLLHILLLLFSLNFSYGQTDFRFRDASLKKQTINFKLINNLIVIPLEINGKNLSFILDTGVNKTILFNLTEKDSLGLKNVKKVSLQGLGKGEPVEALLSKNNNFKIKNLYSSNETIYVIFNDYFDLSSKMGTTIHGIIGYNLLKNIIVKINYNTKQIHFYNPKLYRYKNCKKCEIFPIEFYRKKPYIDIQVQLDTTGKKLTNVKMLIDSGGSDAIWLFENSKKDIITPIKHFNDILGEGLSGPIYGDRSRIPLLKMKSFEINKPTISFLDSVSTRNARNFRERNGSIGGNILKRFKVWIDYPNKRIMLKKNGSFKTGFKYNMSGIDLVYSGKELIREKKSEITNNDFNNGINQNNTVDFVTSYYYQFKPTYKIENIVKNSPADRVGLKKGDILVKINYKATHQYKLEEIIQKFQEKNNKKIRLTVRRNGAIMKFEFRLEERV